MTNAEDALHPRATRELAEFGSALRFSDLPDDVVGHLKLLILDGLGCCLFGAALPWTRKIIDMLVEQGGAEQASIFGTNIRTSVSNAALANGTAGHAFELDDIHRGAIIHPNSLCPPVVFGLAEWRGGRRGTDVLTAIAAGYEVGTRIGRAATQALFFRGFHPQGTTGVFAAAAAAARAIDLDANQTQHALGIAGSQAAGLMAAQAGAMVKRMNAGRAAQSGVYGALLAERGFTGITDVLEAPYGGFLSTMSSDPDPERLTDGLGSVWEIRAVGFKPHAAVTSIHTALDALRDIMQSNEIAADDIAKLEVGVSPMTFTHCAWPYAAQGVTAAQMNLYYGLAVMAIDGAAFVDQYREARLADPAILALIERIEAFVDPDIESLGAENRHMVRLKLTHRDGRVFDREERRRRGSPELPLTADEAHDKFRALVRAQITDTTAEEIIHAVHALDELSSLDEFFGLLRA